MVMVDIQKIKVNGRSTWGTHGRQYEKVVFSATLFSTNRIISAGEIRDAGSADSVFLVFLISTLHL